MASNVVSSTNLSWIIGRIVVTLRMIRIRLLLIRVVRWRLDILCWLVYIQPTRSHWRVCISRHRGRVPTDRRTVWSSSQMLRALRNVIATCKLKCEVKQCFAKSHTCCRLGSPGFRNKRRKILSTQFSSIITKHQITNKRLTKRHALWRKIAARCYRTCEQLKLDSLLCRAARRELPNPRPKIRCMQTVWHVEHGCGNMC